LQAAVIFRLFARTQLVAVIFLVAILLFDGLLPRGMALPALTKLYLLEHPQMTMATGIAIVLRYVLPNLDYQFKPKVTAFATRGVPMASAAFWTRLVPVISAMSAVRLSALALRPM
jgi:hypothetical protein